MGSVRVDDSGGDALRTRGGGARARAVAVPAAGPRADHVPREGVRLAARALHVQGRGDVTSAPCGYPTHRWADWRKPGGPWTCGVCHPPAVPDVELRTPGAPVKSARQARGELEAAKR